MAAGEDRVLDCLPTVLNEKLLPFQRDGVKYAIHKKGRCLIGDEMGLGKTIQAIAVAYYYKSEWPLLIVVPSSLKYPWTEELEKWLPELQPNDINMIASSTDTGGISTSKISILGYGLLRNDFQTLQHAISSQNFQVVIVDESHYIKNMKTARTKILLPIVQNSKRALLLTGTPALSRPAELYPQIQALKANLLGNWTAYAKRYCDAKWKYYGRQKSWDTSGANHLPELHKMLKKHIMIRREKKQVLTQLPPKRKQRIPFVLNDTPQKKEVDRLMENLKNVLNGETVFEEGVNPKIVINGLISSLYIKTAEAKAGAVRDYVKTLLDNRDQKFLVFAHHHFMMQALTDAILEYNKEHHSNIKFIRIDGTVPVAERARLVKSFQNEDDVKVAILSILAAGTGLTLTAATQVVFAELHWTPGVMDQCEDRAHRIGQLNSIQVHYLVAMSTIDDFMWAAISRKVSVVSHALSGTLQQLKVDECDKSDVDFLSHAAAWLPRKQQEDDEEEDDDDDDDDLYFSSQSQDSRQKSILSFFTPKHKVSPRKRKMKSSPRSNIKESSLLHGNQSVVTVISDDEEHFQNQPIRKKLKTSHKPITDCVTPTQKNMKRDKLMTDDDVESDSGMCCILGDNFSTPDQKTSNVRMKADKKQKLWNCGACTFENHDDLPFCEICDTPRKNQRQKEIESIVESENEDAITMAEISDVTTETDDTFTKIDDATDSDDTIIVDYTEVDTSVSKKSAHAVIDKNPTDGLETMATPKMKPVIKTDEEQYNDTNTPHKSVVDDKWCHISVHERFHYSASKYTDRIYLYDESGCPLNASFYPMDVQNKDVDNLPDILHHPHNLRLVKRFVRQWNSINDIRKRQVRKSGEVFYNVHEMLNGILEKQSSHGKCNKRYLTKEDFAQKAKKTAENIGGSVRVVAKHKITPKRMQTERGHKTSPKKNSRRKSKQAKEIEELMMLAADHDDCWSDEEDTSATQSDTAQFHSISPKTSADIKHYPGNRSKSNTQATRTVNSVISKTLANNANKSLPSDDEFDPFNTVIKQNSFHVCPDKDPSTSMSSISVKPCSDGRNKNGDDSKDVIDDDDITATCTRLQVVDSEGRPLCLYCNQPCRTDQSLPSTSNRNHDWDTRYCSEKCKDDHYLRARGGYVREQLFSIEHGICQICRRNIHELYLQVKALPKGERKDFLTGTHFSKLPVKILNGIIDKPSEGKFWQADHIVAVSNGGGLCSLDNFRTLCTVCHRSVTNIQSRQRKQDKKIAARRSAGFADITAFFKS
ncbi:DNA annealing helicase and endonuclease ZRANB3-like [Saccoglossus kowalevskii]|uniref:DNA annealing helicase and endonuclease ZRANB3-like n=1 Tax=Saccoglossus kowalevskii TaxID=10224 RepID=A0ABM0LTT6_SACKO|nr:PREDICTED: DNA annealing helicase and endonuclease ZRANB3-like [Saccoglossus kowalevskii]